MAEGRYLYCVIEEGEPKTFGPRGIGGRGNEIVSVPYHDLACVVSSSPIVEYPVMREHTMNHYQVIENVMQQYTVLPVRFSTIARSDEEIIDKVLKPRYEEFLELLRWISGKEALEVRASWPDMPIVFQELVHENSMLEALKKKLEERPSAATYYDRIVLGKLVEASLKEKRMKTANWILKMLKPHTCEYRDNGQKLYGDQAICYLTFLVEEGKSTLLDDVLARLVSEAGGKIRFKIHRRVVPFDFVTIMIRLDEVANVSA